MIQLYYSILQTPRSLTALLNFCPICPLQFRLVLFLLVQPHLYPWILLRCLMRSICHTIISLLYVCAHCHVSMEWLSRSSHVTGVLFGTFFLSFCSMNKLRILQMFKFLFIFNNSFINFSLSFCVLLSATGEPMLCSPQKTKREHILTFQLRDFS